MKRFLISLFVWIVCSLNFVHASEHILNVAQHKDRVLAIDFTTNGSMFYSIGLDNNLVVSRTADASKVESKQLSLHANAMAKFVGGGQKIGVMQNNIITLYDSMTLEVLKTFSVFKLDITNFAFSNDEKLLLLCLKGGRTYIFSTESGRVMKAFRAHDGDVIQAQYFDDDSQFVTIGADKKVKLWETSSLINTANIDVAYTPKAVALVPNKARKILVAGSDEKIHVYDSPSMKENDPIALGKATVLDMKYSYQGKFLLAILDDASFRVFEYVEPDFNSNARAMKPFKSNISAMGLARDVNYVGFGSSQGSLVIMKLADTIWEQKNPYKPINPSGLTTAFVEQAQRAYLGANKLINFIEPWLEPVREFTLPYARQYGISDDIMVWIVFGVVFFALIIVFRAVFKFFSADEMMDDDIPVVIADNMVPANNEDGQAPLVNNTGDENPPENDGSQGSNAAQQAPVRESRKAAVTAATESEPEPEPQVSVSEGDHKFIDGKKDVDLTKPAPAMVFESSHDVRGSFLDQLGKEKGKENKPLDIVFPTDGPAVSLSKDNDTDPKAKKSKDQSPKNISKMSLVVDEGIEKTSDLKNEVLKPIEKSPSQMKAAEKAQADLGVTSKDKVLKEDVPLQPETLIAGKYKVIRQIGKGGMAVVYEAEDITLGKTFALKKMKGAISASEKNRKRFLEEARITAKLKHPNIVDIYTVLEEGESIYLVFEMLTGRTLSNLLKQYKRLPIKESMQIASHVLAALDYAHAHGVSHRDLKPANIMIAGDGFVRVMDFGIAQIADANNAKEISGTMAYMAPEQYLGQEDNRADIYAFGVTLYEILTGRLPFKKGDMYDVYSIKIDKKYTPVNRLLKRATDELNNMIDKCLEPLPEDRYSTSQEVLSEVKKIMLNPRKNA